MLKTYKLVRKSVKIRREDPLSKMNISNLDTKTLIKEYIDCTRIIALFSRFLLSPDLGA